MARGQMRGPLALACVALMVSACAAATVARPSSECIAPSLVTSGVSVNPKALQLTTSSSGIISTSTYTTVTLAQDFEVTYYDTYKIVTNKRQNETYFLYPCGLAPSADLIPAGAKAFAVPLTATSVSDTTIVAFMSLLGVLDRVANTTEYAVNACMQALGQYGCKRLAGTPGTLSAAEDAEVDAYFVYSKAANSKTIAVTAAPDPGVLNRAEWIKYVSTFFNKEDVANRMFEATAARYATLKAAVAAKANADVTKRPLVAWLYFQPENPAWGKYGKAQVQISFTKYKAEYVQDAGGRMLNQTALEASEVDGVSTTMEFGSLTFKNFATLGDQLRRILADVDVVIDETRYPGVRNVDLTLNDFLATFRLTASDIPNLKFLKNGAILREDMSSNPDGYTDWFEMGVAQPDLVLRDLVAALTPSALNGTNAAPRIVRNLQQHTPLFVEAKQCPTLTSCQQTQTLQPICPAVYTACNGTVVQATLAQRCAPNCTAAGSPNAAQHPTALSVLMLLAAVLAVLATRLV